LTPTRPGVGKLWPAEHFLRPWNTQPKHL